jgi:hypothetical protein
MPISFQDGYRDINWNAVRLAFDQSLNRELGLPTKPAPLWFWAV